MKTQYTLLLLALIGPACGGQDAPDELAEACEHFSSPATSVTASAESGWGVAPDVSTPHTAYAVDLVDAGTGYVTFETAHTAAFFMVVSVGTDLTLFDGDGVAQTLTLHDAGACEGTAEAWETDLSIGAYQIGLTHPTESQISLLIEEASEDEHDHEAE